MKRKVVQQGPSTLMISLPSKWVKENNIIRGEELEVSPKQDTITFSKGELTEEKKEAIINLDNYTYLAFTKYMSMLYFSNYHKITLTYSKPEIFHPKNGKYLNIKSVINKKVARLMGAEIVSQSSNKTEIVIFYSDAPDLDQLEKRTLYIFKEAVSEMLSSIGKDYHKFHEICYDYHDNITKFVEYYLRELQKSQRSESFKKIAFHTFRLIDHLADKYRHISEEINKVGCTPKAKKYIKDIFDAFFETYSTALSKQIPKDIIIRRYELKKDIDKEKFTLNEIKVVAEAKVFLDVIGSFTEYSIAKSLEK